MIEEKLRKRFYPAVLSEEDAAWLCFKLDLWYLPVVRDLAGTGKFYIPESKKNRVFLAQFGKSGVRDIINLLTVQKNAWDIVPDRDYKRNHGMVTIWRTTYKGIDMYVKLHYHEDTGTLSVISCHPWGLH